MTDTDCSRRKFLTGLTASVSGLAFAGACGLVRPAYAAPGYSDIRIKEVRTYALGDRGLWVQVVADNGMTGWGETDAGRPPLMEAFIQDVFARRVVGRDPFDTGPISERLFYDNHDFGPGGALANAIAGVDVAIWDLKARILDVPIYRLLGGAYRDEIKVYGSYGTSRWRNMTAKEAADKALRFVDLGFETVKCRMQIRESHLNPTDDQTIHYIDTIHKALKGSAKLFTDINNGYSASRAIQIGRVLQDEYGMEYFEEPCSDQNHSETRQVVEALDMGIIAGEKEYTPWQVAELIKYANPDYLNPDVVKAMGITGMQKMGVLSQVHQKPIIMHNTRPVISTAASLQVGVSYPILGPFMEYMDVAEDKYAREVALVDEYVTYQDGALKLTEAPGLGITINEGRVRDLATSVRVTTDE